MQRNEHPVNMTAKRKNGNCWKPNTKHEKILLACLIIAIIVVVGLMIRLIKKSKAVSLYFVNATEKQPINMTVKNKNGSCWKLNTKHEKILLACLIIAIVVAVGLMIGLIKKSKVEPQQEETCSSSSCIQAAAELLSEMNETINPCDDFYEYACGNYDVRSIIFDLHRKQDIEAIKILTSLREKFLEPWESSQPRYYKLIKDLHTSCLNTTKIKDDGNLILRVMLNEFGGWPLLMGSNWNEDKFDWTQTLFQFRENGIDTDVFFMLGVHTHSWQSIGSLSIRPPYISTDDWNEESVTNMVEFLGGDKSSTVEKEIKAIIEFKQQLRNITKQKSEEKSSEERQQTLNDLQGLIPQVEWVNFLNKMKPSKYLGSFEPIDIRNPAVLQEISILLARTDKRVIANYMMVDFVREYYRLIQHANSNFDDTAEDVFTNRRFYCLILLGQKMRLGSSAMYIKELFPTENKQLVEDIVNRLKNELYQNLDRTEWIDSQSLEKAKEKLDAMNVMIAYPEELTDLNKIDQYYSMIQISADNFLRNFMLLSKLDKDDRFALLGKTPADVAWYELGKYAFYPNSEIFGALNTIAIFAGAMNGLFFNANWPQYLNYGGIGSYIGSAMIFGLEGTDEHWWSEETEKNYNETKQSLLQQFAATDSNVTDFHINHITAITETENIDLAYKAYENWNQENGPELRLPGLKLNSRQLFWLKSANVWCNEPSSRGDIATRHRINLALKNSDYFTKDFDCPLNSPMNPEVKISFL